MPEENTTMTGQAQGETPVHGQQQAAQAPQSWDDFVATLPAEAKALYDGHITGLRNTVQATRGERDALQERVKAITATLGQDPAKAKERLDELQVELERETRRSAFVEQAIEPAVGCRNPRVAYLVAEAQNLFTRKGEPDWAAIKAAAPELFGPSVPAGNAGNGTANPVPNRVTMNDWIRQAAGRK